MKERKTVKDFLEEGDGHGTLRVRISDKENESHFFDVYVDNLEDAFDRLSFEELI